MSSDISSSMIRWLFAAAMLFALAIGVTVYLSVQLAEADRATFRTHLMIEAVKDCLSALQDVETGERGFALTGERRFLEPYTWGVKNFDECFKRAEALAVDEQQKERLAQLGDLARKKIDFATRTLVGQEVGTRLIQSGEDKRLMDACRARISVISERAHDLMRLRNERLRIMEGLVWTATGILALFGAALLVAVFKITDKALNLERLKAGELGLINTKLNTEIAERVKTEQALRQASQRLASSNRDLQQFAYVASHDLQEPLRAVAGFLTLIARKHSGVLGDETDIWINHAVEGAQRMRSLINDLLSYSRVESRGKELQTVDLNRSLSHALKDLSVAVEESNAEINSEELPAVRGDERQLAQVFQNLIGNAIKFKRADADPVIHITAHVQESDKIISVKDNGIGFEQEHADRIFVIFQRLQGREEYKGTGIGLAICKKIIERHGGRMWAESAPGQGATFNFTFPTM